MSRRLRLLPLALVVPAFAVACGGISPETEAAFQPSGDDAATVDDSAFVGDDGGVQPDAPFVSDTGVTPGDAIAVDAQPPQPDSQPPQPDAPLGPPTNDTCGTAIALSPPSSNLQVVQGDTTDAHPDYTGYACDNGDGNDVVYTFTHPGGDFYVEDMGTTFDSVLSVETTCDQSSTTKACSASTSTGPGTSRTLYRALEPANYFLFVDGQTSGDAGPFRFAYSAKSAPIELTCDSAVVISDVDFQGASRPIGMDVYDRFVSGQQSRSQVRSTTPGGSCTTAAGQQGVGKGMEQVYRLDLKQPRTLTVDLEALNPTSFSGTFDVVVYVRDGGSAPVNNCTQWQGNFLAPDRCVDLGQPMDLPAGTYFLFFDSLLTQQQQQPQGRFRAHVQVE